MENGHIPDAYRGALEGAGYTQGAGGRWNPDFCALPVDEPAPPADISATTRPERPDASNVRYLADARVAAPDRPGEHGHWLGVETATAQVLAGPWRSPEPESAARLGAATALLERPQTHAPAAPPQPQRGSKKAAPAGPAPIGEEGAVFRRFEQALTGEFDDTTVGKLFRAVVASFEGDIREQATADRLREQFSKQVAVEGCGRVILERAKAIHRAVNPRDPRIQKAVWLALRANWGHEEMAKAHLPRKLKERGLGRAARMAEQSLAIFTHAYDRTRNIQYAPVHAVAEQAPSPVTEARIAGGGLRRLLSKLPLRRRRR